MDFVEPILALLVPLAAGGGYLLGHRHPRVELTRQEEPVEVQGVMQNPQGGHKHVWDTMFSDGRGWVCGVPVGDGVICGWSREYGRGGPSDG